MSPPKKAARSLGSKRRSAAPSAPELKVSYAPAGRETMAAIDEELAGAARAAEAPVLELSETPVGRETMAAIAEELADATRPRQNTLPYGDRISNAPGARSPSRAPAPPTARRSRPPRASAVDRSGPPASRVAAASAPEALEIFELVTFLVRGNQVGELSTDAQRRRFVGAHLLGRVPGHDLEKVERVEVTPWTTQGTMVVRVWVRT